MRTPWKCACSKEKQPNRTAFLRKGFVKNLQKKFGNVLKQQASDFTSKIMACLVKNKHSNRIYCKRWSRSKGEIKPKLRKENFLLKSNKTIKIAVCPAPSSFAEKERFVLAILKAITSYKSMCFSDCFGHR